MEKSSIFTNVKQIFKKILSENFIDRRASPVKATFSNKCPKRSEIQISLPGQIF